MAVGVPKVNVDIKMITRVNPDTVRLTKRGIDQILAYFRLLGHEDDRPTIDRHALDDFSFWAANIVGTPTKEPTWRAASVPARSAHFDATRSPVSSRPSDTRRCVRRQVPRVQKRG